MKNIRIIIVDDHEMVIQGLKALIESNPGFEVVKAFTNGMDAIEEYTSINPDIVLMDINMPIINGFDTSSKLLALDQDAKIIMLSMEVNKPYMKKALEEGIKGYVSKSADINELLKSIKNVQGGGMSFNNYMQVANWSIKGNSSSNFLFSGTRVYFIVQ